jgi:hypothetical protein
MKIMSGSSYIIYLHSLINAKRLHFLAFAQILERLDPFTTDWDGKKSMVKKLGGMNKDLQARSI